MQDFSIGDLGVFIGTVGGVITSILIVLQKSHCKKIKFCCWECIRDESFNPEQIKDNKDNKDNKDTIPTQIYLLPPSFF